MADKELGIVMRFTADTTRAAQDLDKLKKELNEITKLSIKDVNGFGGSELTTKLKEA